MENRYGAGNKQEMSGPKKRVAVIVLVGCIGIAAVVFSLKHLRRQQTRYNIILITMDALRPDHLGCYGYARNTSPHIDTIAKEGVIFTQAITQAPYTHGSVPSFFTSTYPYVHTKCFGENRIVYLNPESPCLSKILKAAGYETVFIGDHPYQIETIRGMKDYFDTYIQLEKNRPDQLIEKAIDWVKKRKDKNFFLWVYCLSPHRPYRPSLPYSSEFYADTVSKTDRVLPALDKGSYFGGIPSYIAEEGMIQAGYYIAQYDGRIRIMDEQLGLLFEELKRLDIYDNTLIIIMSDHGESLGEHNYYFHHGLTLYDEVMKVPLIMRLPQGIHPGARINSQVQLLDLMPTIMDIAGIEKKYKGIKGRTLLPCFHGTDNCTTPLCFSNNARMIFSVRSPDWKLIRVNLDLIKETKDLFRKVGNYYNYEYELYDLKNDPREENNLFEKGTLSGQEKEAFINLKQKLDVYIVQQNAHFAASRPQCETKPEPVDEHTKEGLRSLGYLQ